MAVFSQQWGKMPHCKGHEKFGACLAEKEPVAHAGGCLQSFPPAGLRAQRSSNGTSHCSLQEAAHWEVGICK